MPLWLIRTTWSEVCDSSSSLMNSLTFCCVHRLSSHISANIHQGFLPSASSTAPLNLQPNSCTRPYPADQQYSFNIGTRQPYEEPLYSAPEVSRPRSPTPQRCIHNECLRHSHDHHTYASPNGPANSFHPPTANLDPWKA